MDKILKLYSEQKPRHRSAAAIFDLDWTIIKPRGGRRFPKDATDWTWLHPNVPDIIEDYYKKGYGIVIITNQTKQFKCNMIQDVLKELGVPITAIVGTGKKNEPDSRKPSRKLFEALFDDNKPQHKARFKYEKSFYVGDAAGRPGDWSDTDKVFAENIHKGFKFHVPEEFFGIEESSVDSKNVDADFRYDQQEIIIMVGYPASGKSTFARLHFGSDPKYKIVESDKFKSNTKKMILASEDMLDEGFSVVFDGTFPTLAKRKEVIDFANSRNIPVRCFHVATPIEEAMARNQARNQKTDKKVPPIALYTYRKRFEEPTKNECSVITV